MFDIGFFELLVIGVVGLLVIGPERLPETLRTLGLWWGRLKRGIQNTRTEFEQQIGADDIRRQLHNEDIMQRLNSSKDAIARAVGENVDDIQGSMKDVENSLKDVSDSLSDLDNASDTTPSKTGEADHKIGSDIPADDTPAADTPNNTTESSISAEPQEGAQRKPSDSGRH
ncbi:Sec-independent protein translocase protein TatB [Pseudomaricurvus sp.]|uniref:Sec-independent protein translocase protein TatB n=1 Tax=Pseudomaricurvus sp. TaxID=2004510 RepID=UPI003F6B9D37